MKLMFVGAMLLAAAPSLAQPVRHITITMTDHGFEPHRVNVEHGQPYVMRIVNASGRKHNLEAPDFFAATNARGAGVRFQEGRVDVEPHQAITVRFTVPDQPGRFPFKSSLVSDAASGMSGEILIR